MVILFKKKKKKEGIFHAQEKNNKRSKISLNHMVVYIENIINIKFILTSDKNVHLTQEQTGIICLSTRDCSFKKTKNNGFMLDKIKVRRLKPSHATQIFHSRILAFN